MHQERPNERGFSLIELLVVVGIIMILVTILTPSMYQFRRMGHRVKCASNVREIVRGCAAFASEGRFHRDGPANSLPTNSPTIDIDNWGDFKDGNPASLWVLISSRTVARGNMLCPEAKAVDDLEAPAGSDSAFGAKTYSYSYLSQVKTVDNKLVTIIQEARSDLIIAADRNPRCKPGDQTLIPPDPNNPNSRNHRGDGQNVGAIDQSVSWTETSKPNNDDDIYRSAGSSTEEQEGRRKNLDDSFLIP